VSLAGLREAVDAAAAADCDVSWRVMVLDAGTGSVLAHRDPDTVQRTASLGKLLLLIEVARRPEDGSLDPAEPLTPTDADLVRDSGLWWHLSAGSLPLADCAVLVGAFSDNLATNVLLALNADLSMVGGAFRLDPLCHHEPDRGVQLWNKTGTIDDVLGDVGLVSGPEAVVSYAVLTEHDDAHHPGGRDSALAGMAQVGAAVLALVEGR